MRDWVVFWIFFLQKTPLFPPWLLLKKLIRRSVLDTTHNTRASSSQRPDHRLGHGPSAGGTSCWARAQHVTARPICHLYAFERNKTQSTSIAIQLNLQDLLASILQDLLASIMKTGSLYWKLWFSHRRP